jgi:hypothetical protein
VYDVAAVKPAARQTCRKLDRMRWSKQATWHIDTAIAVAPEGATKRWTVRYEYPDWRSLSIVGPVCHVNWCVSDQHEAALLAKDEQVPKPISGYALIDTGAMHSCLSGPVVTALQLPQAGDARHHGAHSEAALPTYEAHLILAFQASDGQHAMIEKKGRFAALHQLEEYFEQVQPRDAVGGPHTHLGVIGRDILQYMTMTYDGRGALTLSWTEADIRNASFDAFTG